MVYMLINLIILMIFILMGVAFLTLFERKLLGYIHNRKGPNKLLIKGLMQPFSDAMKLLSKEILYYLNNNIMYLVSPMFMFMFSLILWLVYPWMLNYLNYSIIIIIVIFSLNIYPIMFIGWCSNNNYGMLGSMRMIAQMISFEIILFILIFIIMMFMEDYSMFYQQNLVNKSMFMLMPIYLILFISMLIELNRTPFDLIEGESELVSGFNVEYMSGLFTLIFLAEYMNVMFMSFIITYLFFNHYLLSLIFFFINLIHLFMIILIRGVLPRIRYDQMMFMCWSDFLLFILVYMIYVYTLKEMFIMIM